MTQFIAVVGIMCTLITSVTGLIIALHTGAKTTTIRADVNHNLQAMTDRVEQLTHLLSLTNAEVPPKNGIC